MYVLSSSFLVTLYLLKTMRWLFLFNNNTTELLNMNKELIMSYNLFIKYT